MSQIQENLQIIRENIEKAAKKNGRSAEEITLVGVTKTVDAERINELVSLGVTELGENKVQELLSKMGQIKNNPHWHLIGHLQTNKVKQAVGCAKLIQSVDSLKLAEEIDKRARQTDKVMDILIEINIGNEDLKYGIDINQTELFVEHLCNLPNICIKGLMCIGPFVENPEENRHLYEKMMKKYVAMQDKFCYSMGSRTSVKLEILSMGMTNDYTVAIEQGANMVRVGTALFGDRKQ
jgi:pyridoxal phosphate enzyme (YggS family)